MLPVREPESLLQALASTWADECRCSSLFVSILVHGQAFGLLRSHGQSRLMEARCSHAWTAAAAAEWLSVVSDNGPQLLNVLTVIPFETLSRNVSSGSADAEDQKSDAAAGAVGGLLAFEAEPESSTVRELADLSARLTLQLQLVGPAADEEHTARCLRNMKLEAMAEFAAGAGHEINNPVATIAGRSALLLKGESDPGRRRALETIGGQAYRIRDMIGDAMTFARPPEMHAAEISPDTLIMDVLSSFAELADSQGTSIEVDLEERLQIRADPEQFRVVVASLVRNSLEALVEGGQIQISLQSDGKSFCILKVADDGQGPDETEREHLFDPFFSGRQAGRGLGFGLAKCWQILRSHRGWLDTDDGESGFAVVAAWPLV